MSEAREEHRRASRAFRDALGGPSWAAVAEASEAMRAAWDAMSDEDRRAASAECDEMLENGRHRRPSREGG